jgi:hypothetical protein
MMRIPFITDTPNSETKPTAAFSDEIANARICAGFHYRFSTIAGREMGQKIGAYVVTSVMQPVQSAIVH